MTYHQISDKHLDEFIKISEEEGNKYKTLKSGEIKRFIYYNCTRRKDPNCPEKYINEPTLWEKLLEFIEANHGKMKFSDKLMAKAEKHHNITKTLFSHYKVEQDLDVPIIEYARYVLMRGTENEMTAFSRGLNSNLTIKGSKLRFQKE